MSFCVASFLRRFRRPQQIDLAQHAFLPNFATELEDSRKFSLNSLMALLAILATSGSKALQPVVLTLLMYIITLRLALDTCFLQDHPTMSRLLHAIPLLGTVCMAGIELALGMRSPALAAVCTLLGVLPLVAMVVHHGKRCAAMSMTVLPVRMEHVPAFGVSGSVDTMPASNQAEGSLEVFSSNLC